VPDLFKHLAQLAVAPLDQHHFVPGVVPLAYLANARRRGANLARSRFAPLDGHAAAKHFEFRLGRLAADFYKICFLNSRGRFGQLIRELAIVGHQQQALTHVVKPADRVKSLAHLFKELHDRGTTLGVLHRGHKAFRFVQNEIAQALRALQQLSIHADVVASRIGLGAQLGHNLAVDLNSPFFDQLLSAPPARHTRLRQNLLQAFQLRRRSWLRIVLRVFSGSIFVRTCRLGSGVAFIGTCGFFSAAARLYCLASLRFIGVGRLFVTHVEISQFLPALV
jgi:hypothetical protein